LKDASCAVVVICASTLLYCETRLARLACEFGSATGPVGVPTPANRLPELVAEPENAPIVEDAASFVFVMLSLPVLASNVACRLLAASAVLRSFNDATLPVPVPKVIIDAVPPPVAAIVR